MVGVDFCDSDNITPMDSMRRLALLHLVMETVKSLELIPREYEYLVRPFRSLRVNVVNAVRPFGHEAKVMASTPDGPEEVRVRVFRHGHDIAARKNQPRRDDLIGGKAIFTLQPPMTAAESGCGNSHTLADAGD